MKKRMMVLLITAVLIVTLIPAAAMAEKSDTDIAYGVTGGNIYFDASTWTVTGCDESVTEAAIPQEIGGAAVKSIGEDAFSLNSSLTSVTLSEGISSIEPYAFGGCTALTSVTLPSTLTSIGESAFNSCEALTAIQLPESLTSIGKEAFWYCTGLTSIMIPSGVTEIGANAFSDCSSLKSVYFNGSEDEWTALTADTDLGLGETPVICGPHAHSYEASVTAPTCTKQGYTTYTCACGHSYKNTYTDALGHTEVIDAAVASTCTEAGKTEGKHCSVCNDILDAQEEVAALGHNYVNHVCSRCDAIDTDSIVASGTCGAEGDGSNLTWTLFNDGVLEISGTGEMASWTTGKAPWYGYLQSQITSVIINDGVTSIGNYAFCDTSGNGAVLMSVTIPNSVTSIGEGAFYGCTNLTSITISSSVTSIGEGAFAICVSLTSITVSDENTVYVAEDGVLFNKEKTEIIQYAAGKTEASYTIPNSVTSIGGNAFGGCIKLTSITIPNSVTSIGGLAFFGCTSLTNITIPDSVTSIGDLAFFGCTSLTSVTIPNSVPSIGGGAFWYCTSLTSITIPDSVTSIEAAAFFNCTSLTSITIPDSVTSIGMGAFSSCTSLASITIPGSVTSIGEDAFSGCTALETITLENCSITSGMDEIASTGLKSLKNINVIGESSLYSSIDGVLFNKEKTALIIYPSGRTSTSYEIPNSVTSIGEWAFSFCRNLTSITIPNSVTSIGNDAFLYCTSLTSVTIPNSVTSIDYAAFYNCTSLTDVYYSGSEDQWAEINIDSGNDPLSSAAMHYKDITPPTQPGIAAMLSRGTKHITFNWEKSTDNFAVEKYYVYRNGEEIAEVIAEADDSLPSYTDTGLDEGTTYTYTVKAADAAGNISIASAAAELTTATLNISSSTTLSSLYYRQQLEKIRLTVKAQQDKMYDVNNLTAAFEYKLENADGWNTLALDFTGTTGMYTALWDISNIDTGNYNVRITVKDEDETEKTLWEDKIITIKDDDVAPIISMSSPKADSVYGVTQEITISGSASDNILLSKVVISYFTDGNDFTDITTFSLPDEKSSYSYSFAWTPTGTSGSVIVRATAYDEWNNSAYTERKITVDADAPDDVSDFAVTSTSSHIQLAWSYGSLTSDSDFSTFRIYRAESEDGSFSEICSQKTIGYYNDGITASLGTTYYYYVTAVDIYGNESSGSPVEQGSLLPSTDGPTIGDMRPYADEVLCKSAVLRVTAADNYRLSKAVFEYRALDSDTWTEIATKNVSGITNSTVFSCDWNIESLETGTYEVRVSVYDISDNEGGSNAPTVITRTYSIKAYSAPRSPSLSACSAYKAGTLTWTYDGNADLLDHYNLYCASSENGTYSLVRTLAKGNTKYQVTIPIGQVYYYKINAVDAYGAVAQSNVVSVQSSGTDSEAPVAVISPEVLFTAKGISFQFSGVNSTDNDIIASYNWSFGDGATSTAAAPVHAYSSAGSFTVSLTVTDEAGNTGTEERIIEVVDTAAEDCEYTLVTFSIVDASKENTPAIPNALLYITYGIEGFGATTAECDENGTVTLLMPRGDHIVNVTAGEYMPTAKNIKVTEGDNGAMTATIGLSETSLVAGKLTATEMTYDEIVAAGIDVSSPDNEHVWKFETTLTFKVGLKTFELPVIAGYKNDAGTFKNDIGGWYSIDDSDDSDGSGGSVSFGGSAGGSGWKVGVFPLKAEGFYFVIYGEAHWLKEMYNVELLVINNSYTDTIKNCVAELVLPEGLSLADMLTEQQSCIADMGDIDHASKKTARWYVRGDAAGEYYISADVTGEMVSDGVTEPFTYTFTTDKTVKVYAGDALMLTITADDVAERGKDYKVVFRLSNVSDKSLYNLSFGITGIEQGKILSIKTNDGIEEKVFPSESEDFKDSLIRKVDELAPGGYMEIAVTTTCWFKSDAELAAAAARILIDKATGLAILGQFIDIAYYLDSVSVVTLEGSTTSIPYEIIVNRVERENMLEVAVYGLAEEIFGDKLPILFDGLGGTLIKYVGENNGIDSYIISGAKALLKLQQGETDYTFTIKIDDGKSDGSSIYNDYISITSGTPAQAIIDMLNGGGISLKNGDISISAKGPGDTKFEIEVKDIYGTTVEKYTVNLEISDEKMKSTLVLSPTYNKFSVETEEFQAVLQQRTKADQNLFLRNPCMIFDSEISLKMNDYASGSNYSVEFNTSDILKLLTETVVTKLTCDGQTAQLGFDRAALQAISDRCGEKVTVSACRLTDEEAQKLGSTQPTYKFAVEDEAGKVVSDFGDGSVFVSLPYELGNGENIAVEHIKEDGTVEIINCVYNSAAKTVEFVTNGFSYFRIIELEQHDAVYGDLTGDGKVDVSDLIRLKKYIASDTTEIAGKADLNGDGVVDILDLIRLKKMIASS